MIHHDTVKQIWESQSQLFLAPAVPVLDSFLFLLQVLLLDPFQVLSLDPWQMPPGEATNAGGLRNLWGVRGHRVICNVREAQNRLIDAFFVQFPFVKKTKVIGWTATDWSHIGPFLNEFKTSKKNKKLQLQLLPKACRPPLLFQLQPRFKKCPLFYV